MSGEWEVSPIEADRRMRRYMDDPAVLVAYEGILERHNAVLARRAAAVEAIGCALHDDATGIGEDLG